MKLLTWPVFSVVLFQALPVHSYRKNDQRDLLSLVRTTLNSLENKRSHDGSESGSGGNDNGESGSGGYDYGGSGSGGYDYGGSGSGGYDYGGSGSGGYDYGGSGSGGYDYGGSGSGGYDYGGSGSGGYDYGGSGSGGYDYGGSGSGGYDYGGSGSGGYDYGGSGSGGYDYGGSGSGGYDYGGSGSGGYDNGVGGSEYYNATPEFENPSTKFVFPGAFYLTDLIVQGLEGQWDWLPVTNTVDVSGNYTERLAQKMFRSMRIIEDPEAVALAFTRLVTDMVFQARWACAATVIDASLAKFINIKLYQEVNRPDNVAFLKERLWRVFPYDWMMDELMGRVLRDFHGMIANETNEFLMQMALRDVAETVHTFYENAVMTLGNITRKKGQFDEDKFWYQLFWPMFGVGCPNMTELQTLHQTTIQKFLFQFERMTEEELCGYIQEYFIEVSESLAFMKGNAMSGAPFADNPWASTAIEEICERASEELQEIVEYMMDFRVNVGTREMLDTFMEISDSFDGERLWTAFNLLTK